MTTRDAVTLRQALNVARTGAVGSVDVKEAWVHESPTAGRSIVHPGLVDLAYLRSLTGVRELRPEDAR